MRRSAKDRNRDLTGGIQDPFSSQPSSVTPYGLIEQEEHRSELDPFSIGQESVCEPDVSDEILVREYLESRCQATFEKLVRRYERELYTYLRRFLGSVQAAEDVFQATFLSVHLRIHQYEEGRRFRPWLYAIASNKAIDYMRRNKRHQAGSLNHSSVASEKEDPLIHRLEGGDVPPDALAMARETSARVREAVQQLNEPTQQLIHLAFYQGLKYQDIAQILQIPLGTVKSRVFTAIRKLNSIWLRMEEKS
jgi:RNA polymerase sigma-70 factor (ECF subfamily)